MKKILFAAALAGMLTACTTTPNTVSGTVVDASMNTVTIETADHQTYTFSTMDADKSGLKQMLIGEKLYVMYSGQYQPGSKAEKVSTSK